MQYSDDLFTLRGRVSNSRPGLTGDFITHALNDRMRQILDRRTIWSDLLTFGILSFPDPFTTGTVSLATGSSVVTGVGTGWPVSDVVNTTIAAGVPEFGYVEVEPASMAGITDNSLLYVDAAGTPEIVPVVEKKRATFVGKFAYTHAAGCTLTQSSLATRQFRLSQSYPIFTVGAVVSATSLKLMLAWGGPALADQTYTIKVMYVTLASDLKSIIAMKDEQTGWPVRLHVPLEEANYRDARRTMVSGNPYYSLIDLGANEQGNMLYEVWPAPTAARQFSYAYNKQWPDLQKDTDRPPPFINPSLLYYGALADAKMHRVDKNDAYYDPVGAKYYSDKHDEGMWYAINADNAKCLEALRQPWWKGMLPGNFDTQQLIDPAVAAWDMGGGAYY